MHSSFSARALARVRVAAAVALAFGTLTAATCGDSGDGDDSAVVGTYQLTGVATAALPGVFVSPAGQTFACGTETCEFQSGSVTLNASGNFSLSVQGLRRANGGAAGTGVQESFVTTAMQTGTWAQSGTTITFTPSTAALGTFTGELRDGNREMRVNVALTGSNNYVLRFEQ